MKLALGALIIPIAVAILPMLGATQAPNRPPMHLAGPTVEGQQVEGRITRIDPLAGTITLDNGKEYFVPAAALADRRALSTGAMVRLRYDVDGGRNLVTFVQAGF